MVKRTLAITGSEGFIGRAVVASALRAGEFRVIRVVRPGAPIAKIPGTETVEADLVRGWPRELTHVDDLIHLAWQVLDDFRSDLHLLQIASHAELLSSAMAAGVSRVIGVGTCLEYGKVEGELHEDSELVPTLPYARAKAAVGEHLLAEAERRGLQSLWGRVFYPFGPGQAERSLWASVQRAIASGRPSIDMSPGDQERDFLPVDSVGTALIGLLAVDEWGWRPVNICSGRPMAVRDLVAEWIESAGATLSMNLGALPYPDYEPHRFWGSRARLEQLLHR